MTKLGSKKFEFTKDDWCHLDDLRETLQPFFVSTEVISAKNYPTLAAAYSGKLKIKTSSRNY